MSSSHPTMITALMNEPNEELSNDGFSNDGEQGYVSSPNSTPPPRADEIDRWRCHTGLEQFGQQLQEAANNAFPNTSTSRYRNVYVLMLSWQDEDPKLPVSLEVLPLVEIFRDLYHFDTEVWHIPDNNSHMEVVQKILDFANLGGNSKDDLKIVYYAGHGKLSRSRQLSWTSWRNRSNQQAKCPTVKWSGIQNTLEQAQSDVLLLLDCCNAGTVNTDEGEGVTELISACAWNSEANGVGSFSFTHALVVELQELGKLPFFSTGQLYSNIFSRIQARMPESGKERHPAPVHLVLTNDSLHRRSITLSKRLGADQIGKETLDNTTCSKPKFGATSQDGPGLSTMRGSAMSTLAPEWVSSEPRSSEEYGPVSVPLPEVPRLVFAIRLRDNFQIGQLSTDLFLDWLRHIPAIAEQVKVEAGFHSFSSLLIMSLPISLSGFLPSDPAIISLGPVTSSNLIRCPHHSIASPCDTPTKSKTENKSAMKENRQPQLSEMRRESQGSGEEGYEYKKPRKNSDPIVSRLKEREIAGIPTQKTPMDENLSMESSLQSTEMPDKQIGYLPGETSPETNKKLSTGIVSKWRLKLPQKISVAKRPEVRFQEPVPPELLSTTDLSIQTITLDSHSSTMSHEIQVYDQPDANSIWNWFVEKPEEVGQYSRRLGDQVKMDRAIHDRNVTKIKINVSGGPALRLVISTIPGTNNSEAVPKLKSDKHDHGFSQLLKLGTVCWEYECAIAVPFQEFAHAVERKHDWWGSLQGRKQCHSDKSMDWLFTAVVFQLKESFSRNFAQVILDYDASKDTPNAEIPEDFQKAVSDTRQEIVVQTCNFMRDTWISLNRFEKLQGVAMTRIRAHLMKTEFSVDLLKPVDKYLYMRISPLKLLTEFERILCDVDVEVAPESEESELWGKEGTVSSRHGTQGRGGAFGSIARRVLSSRNGPAKYPAENKLLELGSISNDRIMVNERIIVSSQSSTNNETWLEVRDSLLRTTKEWRLEHFRPPFEDTKFARLRSQHILPTV